MRCDDGRESVRFVDVGSPQGQECGSKSHFVELSSGQQEEASS